MSDRCAYLLLRLIIAMIVGIFLVLAIATFITLRDEIG
jgi:hypothetical protein